MGQYINPISTSYLNLSGGTVTGATVFTQSLSALTFHGDGSNLTGIHDYYVTGGSNSGYVVTLSRNDGVDVVFSLDSFVVKLSGDTYTTGGTFANDHLTFYTNGGAAYSVSIENFTGITVDDLITSSRVYSTTISGGTLFSGSTNLYNIFAPIESITRVKSGLNTYTGGTETRPTINISSATLNNLTTSGTVQFSTASASIFSASTYISGNTNLYNIFAPIESITKIQPGLNVYTGGTETRPTINISAATLSSIFVSGNSYLSIVSATTLSALTIFSGSTNLYNIFATPSQNNLLYVYKSGDTMTGGLNVPFLSANTITASTSIRILNSIAGDISAQFGASLPFYITANWPTLGFNAQYLSGGWKYGAGSSSNYAAYQTFDPRSGFGIMSYSISDTTGNSGGVANMRNVLNINYAGNIQFPLGYSTGLIKSDASGNLSSDGTIIPRLETFVKKSGDTITGAILINNTLVVTGVTTLDVFSATQMTLGGTKIVTKNNIVLSGDVLNGGSW